MPVHSKALIDHIPASAPVNVEALGNVDAVYGSATGPFLAVTLHFTGDTIYLNEVGLRQIAEPFGWVDPQTAAQLRSVLDELGEENEKLRGELEREKLDKTVPLADVVDFFEEREKRRPGEPAPATKPAA